MLRAITLAARAFEASIIEDIREAFLIYSGNICYGSWDGNSMTYDLANYIFLLDCDIAWIEFVLCLLGPIVRADFC